VLRRGRDGWVVTHGEPHGANVVWTASGAVLVDCGDLRLAPPERDLANFGVDGDRLATATYRRHYVLSEIAEYAGRLSRRHGDDAEDRRARDQLHHWLAQTDPSPA
jgi:spectinomycin phosphotransferase